MQHYSRSKTIARNYRKSLDYLHHVKDKLEENDTIFDMIANTFEYEVDECGLRDEMNPCHALEAFVTVQMIPMPEFWQICQETWCDGESPMNVQERKAGELVNSWDSIWGFWQGRYRVKIVDAVKSNIDEFAQYDDPVFVY